jgi:hypothetical protein
MSSTNETSGLHTIHGATSMTRFPRTLLFALLFAGVPVHAVGLPDTGQDICYDETGADGVAASDAASISGDAGTHPRQDCRYGRDAAAAAGVLTKTGGGAKGFDYTKIANNGTTLGAGAALGNAATDWACTKDNITGLTWEVKTASVTDLGYSGHTYTWYSSDGSTNGGNAGGTGGNTCNSTLPGNLCNTEAFITAVNNAVLCFHTDWRMPTRRELLTLVYADASIPSIDLSYFPNLPPVAFWSASSYVPDASSAWFVDFADGYSNASDKSHSHSVRLVRGGQF